ncbi:hypothetical protein MnTg02_01947 [bacterium MnTg02]|nr:hypothetical protein MnTg02_01947 [bacterium MnTg02]
MRRAYMPVLCFLLVLIGHAGPASAERRVALVIGNSTYEHTAQLPNPKNDASDMAVALKRLGFDVTTGLDLTEEKFLDVVSAFSDKLSDADVALFFYAGHGVQYQNVNYLIPVDAALRDEFRLKRETIALGDIIEQMEGRVPLNLVFLDACRNNPLADSLKRGLKGKGRAAYVGRGLARIEGGGRDTLITFAAAPGAVAADGVGRNSPFTAALLKHMETPGVEIEVMLKRVTGDVRRSTSAKQEPERLSRLTTEFYFKPRSIAVEAKPDAGGKPTEWPPSVDNKAVELAYWDSVKDSKDAEDFRSYLRQFPDGVFIDLAERRIERLEKQKTEQLDWRSPARDPERDFWESIKDSTDPEVFKSYLGKYSKGIFAEIARLKIKELSPVTKPSFNCKTARKITEVAICNSPELSRLDVEMSALYFARRSGLGGNYKRSIVDSQRQWLGERNACGYNKKCLRQKYLERIRYLGG